jgi:glycosyltransferase involved in cell wall biosynthesis
MPKLLIIAPTFFPDTVVAGVRVTQWARHLPDFGWTPLVVCRHRGHTATAESLAERVHSDVRVEYLGPRVASPAAADSPGFRRDASLSGYVKQLVDAVSVPDALVWKWKSLANEAVAIARRWQPDVVLSSSTPHSIHVAGRRVARAVDAPWVADFRDPYLIDCRHQPRGMKRALIGLHRKFDRDIYREADLCVHAIPVHARWASLRYPFARDKIRTLTNGIPAELLNEQFVQSVAKNEIDNSRRFSIRAVGVLGQGAVPLIAAALRLLVERGIDAEFRHVGYARDARDSIPAEMRDRIQLLGPVSHHDALREIAGADMLLKYDDPERAEVIGLSSKLFEYLAMGRPIVAVNPTRPDWQLIERLPWCWCLEGANPAALADALQQAFTTRTQPPDDWLSTFRTQYNRRNQSGQLAQWLDDLVAHRH